jgi:autotransporter-associated beta strand protein
MRPPPNLHRALSALQRLGLACAAGVALLIGTGTALAAPANDDFANAINLPGNSGTQTGTNNTGATLEVDEPNPGATNTVWFKWTCPADGNFTYGTLGSTNGAATEWDAIIGIYTGAAVNALSPLGATPKNTVLEESMTIRVTGGTAYYIQLAGFGGEAAANILLNWNFVAFRWKGADGGNWTNVANWNNTVPGAADIAILSDGSTAGQTLTLDADAAVAGLTFNNLVANQVIASPAGKTLTLESGSLVTADDGSHAISANVDITLGKKLGRGNVNLSGTVAVHGAGIAMFVSDGVLGISGTTTFDATRRMRIDGSGTLEVTGVLNTAGTLFPVGSGPSTATATVILKGSGQWNQTHSGGGDIAIGISDTNNGRLIIQDTAQLNSAFMVLGFFGPGTGTVQQDGGTVTLVTTPANYTALARPALRIGGSGPGDYHLNGGTLKCGTIGGSGKLYFNGGTLVANMDDLIIVDPGGDLSNAVGLTNFMQGLNQVVVQSGAVIDTAGHIITIDQDLEHDFRGPALDGGLTKQGLGTLTLLRASCYTGPTRVRGGTLACATADSVAPTALEIDAAAKVDLTYTGNRNIPSLKIGVNVKAPGVYGSSSSPAPLANQDDIHFAGTGTVTVGGSTGFTSWADANAPGQTPAQDHDNDGVKNGVEYFMGETGSSFTAMPGLDGTNTVTWTMDKSYIGTYEVQTSTDLATWANVAPRPVPSGGGLSYTLQPGAPGGKSFLRLLVTPTP